MLRVTGRDTYDFSRLNSGWVVESVQLHTLRRNLPGNCHHRSVLGSLERSLGAKKFHGWSGGRLLHVKLAALLQL